MEKKAYEKCQQESHYLVVGQAAAKKTNACVSGAYQ
jgi:hypothetical protein